MRKFGLGAAAALLCAAGGASAQEAPMDWVLYVNEGRVSDAMLIFQQPETDHHIITLSCEEGGARIFAALDPVRPNLRVVGLKAGSEALVVGGKTHYAEEEDYHYFRSREIDGNSPLFQAFAASGELTLLISGEETAMKAKAKSKAAIARFVAFCRG